jgi:hypothetical protein
VAGKSEFAIQRTMVPKKLKNNTAALLTPWVRALEPASVVR